MGNKTKILDGVKSASGGKNSASCGFKPPYRLICIDDAMLVTTDICLKILKMTRIKIHTSKDSKRFHNNTEFG